MLLVSFGSYGVVLKHLIDLILQKNWGKIFFLLVYEETKVQPEVTLEVTFYVRNLYKGTLM